MQLAPALTNDTLLLGFGSIANLIQQQPHSPQHAEDWIGSVFVVKSSLQVYCAAVLLNIGSWLI